MNRIEEIRKIFNGNAYPSLSGTLEQDDIRCFLSKLEIAEKVLERISFETFGRDEPFSGSAYNLAQEALQQIRT